MKNTERTNFDRILADRAEWVKISKKNNLFSGFRSLLTDLYPDTAHFVYELLQNAQDASRGNDSPATVRFALHDEALVFEHNGSKLFDIADVEAILSIGEGTKREDETSIGKFGAGFKSVFAYSSTPQIHSGPYHFRIHDLVVPQEMDPIDLREWTRFVLPFDNPEKPAKIAVAEIERELLSLGSETLLFLKNISRIEYFIEKTKAEGSVQRFDEGDGIVRIVERTSSHRKKEQHWLRYERIVKIHDEAGESTTCPIAIAFKLEVAGEGRKTRRLAPIPPNNGNVFIYFPAVKENSGLYFYIHAPFASTVARDSIRDCSENKQLIGELAKLLTDFLPDIRARGLLTMDFLSVMPNNQDIVSADYVCIREAVLAAFQKEPLLPTKSGNHAPADALYRGPARISEVISDSDLSLLTGYKVPLWVKNPAQINVSRESRFLDSLRIDTWGYEELAEVFLREDEEAVAIEHWVSKKEDRWLNRLYALLEEAEGHGYGVEYIEPSLRIVRTTEDEHVGSREAFFSVDASLAGSMTGQGPKIVKPETYENRKKGAKNTSVHTPARCFLERIGVRQYDIQVEVQGRLDKYKYGFSRKIPDAEHMEDIRRFLSFIKAHPDKVGIFRREQCFRGLIADQYSWMRADEIFIDVPFVETGLGEFTDIHRKKELWGGYKEKLPKAELQSLIDLLVKLGALKELRIEKASITRNPDYYPGLFQSGKTTSYAIQEDYTISGLEAYIGTQSPVAALLIWNAVITEERQGVTIARNRPNQSALMKTADSQLVHTLKNEAWIPDKTGVFRTPQDMTVAMLRPEFRYDDNNCLLSAIGFGKNAALRDAGVEEEREKKTAAAKTLGLSPDNIELLQEAEAAGIDIRKVISHSLRSEIAKGRAIFPEQNSPNPDRRKERIQTAHEEAQPIQYQTVERSRRVSSPGIAAKTYLRDGYTNEDGQLVCQICKLEMPFRKRDGEHYFEAVSAFNTPRIKRIKRESEINALALCPLCAAKYKEFIASDESTMDEFLLAFLQSGGLEIPLELDRHSTIRFTEKHMGDLRAVLEVETQEQPTTPPPQSTSARGYKPTPSFSNVKKGSTVIHKEYGAGRVISVGDGRITIKFRTRESSFVFPAAFLQGFLSEAK